MTVCRVAVIDDDDVSRRGYVELLGEHPDIEVAVSLDHSQAVSWPGEWKSIDVALVDAADDRSPGDQFPGVAVVERIRCLAPPGRPVIVVVTGHFFDDAVRTRMREARADLFYHRSEFADVHRLYQVILHPETERSDVPPPRDADALIRLGVNSATNVNKSVRWAADEALLPEPGSRLPRGRARYRLRRNFNRVARLNPVNKDGTPPDRVQDEPSLPQIERFLRWATRSKEDRP